MKKLELKTKMYPHQEAAAKKLLPLRVGALYMEQGTGKTRTVCEIVADRAAKGKIDSVLWLCPCSVKRNLKDDLIFHCGEKPDWIVIRGIESLSSSDRLYVELYKLVTTHKVMIVVDESNLTKNKAAIRTERIIELASHCKYRMILNGTPVSKNEADMFAQWYILDWRILGYRSYYSFAANHLEFEKITLPSGREVTTDRVIRVLNVDYLARKIAPYTYQVRKSECLSLPDKHYEKKYAQMSEDQAEIYYQTHVFYLDNVDELRAETIYKFFTALQHVVSGRCPSPNPREKMRTTEIFDSWHENPRIWALEELMDERIGDEKVIIFTKYQAEIDEIEAMLNDKGISHLEFTGRVPQKQRQKNLEGFRGDAQVLVANKVCGAYGLNLQFCRNMIFYSNDFDLATRSQAEDRIHRIGQTHEVYIYDIIMEDSIDTFIDDCLSRKVSMANEFKRRIKKHKKFDERRDKDGKSLLTGVCV